MLNTDLGRILAGNEEHVRRAHETLSSVPVDQEVLDGDGADERQLTIAGSCRVSGSGTFTGKAERTLTLLPPEEPGWWIDRRDLPDSLPLRVSIENVWTTGNIVSNIVLRAGDPHNYLRMVEHIVALKVGMGLDHLMIHVDSGDPPLLDRGSLDLVEAVETAGTRALDDPVVYVGVKEPVTMASDSGGFLTLHPPANGSRALTVDCAIDFPNAIGRQRIRFAVNRDTFRHGAFARTNTSLGVVLYCKTIGKIFADIRNLGYTMGNILVAGPNRYFNEARLDHNGKSLEAVWHRAALDLLAAVALIPGGRLAGHVVSYKAGHGVDCRMVTRLVRDKLLERLS